jgi:hypothetical protein
MDPLHHPLYPLMYDRGRDHVAGLSFLIVEALFNFKTVQIGFVEFRVAVGHFRPPSHHSISAAYPSVVP